MNIFILGDDARMCALREEAVARGHTLSDAAACNAGVLPLPDSRSAFAALLSLDGGGRTLLCGRMNASQCEILSAHGWKLKNIQEDEEYVSQNALISAEGALSVAMQQTDYALRNTKCAVVGYGRIGKELTRLLLALGAQVNVVARRESARLQAILAGAQAYDVNRLPAAFSQARILFNTVPSRIIEAEALEALSPGALVMELASPPYGFDLDAAKKMGFNALLESGIPSRYAPRTAARLLMDHLEAGENYG